MKSKTSFALSDECRKLLAWLKKKLGVSQAGVIEIAVREKAKKEKK